MSGPVGSLKAFLRANFPGAFKRAQAARDRVRDEFALLRRVGISGAIGLLRSRAEVESAMDSGQALRRLDIRLGGSGDLDSRLRARGIEAARGAHALYLSPAALNGAGLGALLADYPDGAGLKILRSTTATEGDRYVHGPNMSSLQDSLAYGARGLGALSNALWLEGIAPRVYDVCRVLVDASEHLAFVVEHVPHAVRERADFDAGHARVDSLLASERFTLVDPSGYKGADFAPPDGNGNFRKREDGSIVYVDTQNFVFRDYPAYLSTAAERWVEPSHFGGKSVIRGGKYLYQSIPGLPQAGKRDSSARETRYTALLAQAGIAFDGRFVFDIGGNLGRMSALALKNGARWAHLWDMPATAVAATEAMLLTGYSRVTTTGGRLVPDKDLPGDIPPHLRRINAADGLVLYLAIHHHVGWLEKLGELPWRHLLFEGPEEQTIAQRDAVIAQLSARVPVRMIAAGDGADGDSRPRPCCVLERIG